ncbi:MAG: hydantoinase B/oxoprolinase family protein [Gammaproteobacteria bacterium]|nr:hydantoinase B/oxoprolinase family protein [Gammaproteobacteria bacterium]
MNSELDPITLSVLWSALVSVADDMGVTLRRTAYSAAVREGDDFSTGLFDAQGRLIAQGNFSPGHLGAMPYVVEHVLAHYPVETLRPHDCILLNDSFMGSGHYPDCFVTSPLFYAEELVGFAVNTAHHVDMGGAVPGSQIVTVDEAFQEGLRILPIRIAEAGELREDILRLILGNVRLPDIVRGDLLAQRNTNAVAQDRIQRLFSKYGVALITQGIDEILNRSEARMRECIRELPDGVYEYEDVLDDCGPNTDAVRFHVAVTIADDSIELDWSGSCDQVAAGINSYINYTRAYSCFAIKVFSDPLLPHNAGAIRPIGIRAREGSIFNPRFPAPSSGRAAIQIRLFEVVAGALAGIAPNRAIASFSHWSNPIIGGVTDDTGDPFVFYDVIFGGYGGSRNKDGEESLCPVFNATNIPIEIHEANNPVRIRSLALIDDSGGDGEYRGGCGVRKELELLCESATLSLSGDRHVFAPAGLAGGRSGRLGSTYLIRGEAASPLHSKETRTLARGDIVRIETSGAGGYGDPSKRSIDAVALDAENGYRTSGPK